MFLKNYTSNVPVSGTIHRIEKVLLRCGVTGITKDYGDSPAGPTVIAVAFSIQFNGERKVQVRLPADVNAAWDALWLDYVGTDKLSHDGNRVDSGYKKKVKNDFREQAERTAWRIVQDWVEVQMSMIQMRQADVVQVFLPYLWDGKRTYYQGLKENHFAGLLEAPK